MFKNSVLELSNPEGAVLFNLAAFPKGPEAVLDRIAPGQRGIYAWFRTFDFREAPGEFEEDLLRAIESPKFQPRTGPLTPYYEVSVRSRSSLSEGKRRALSEALKKPDFSSTLRFCLDWSVLLQAPLYIGKSVDLKTRVSQHLRSGSDLQLRLEQAHIPIERCLLLIVPMAEKNGFTDPLYEADIEEDEVTSGEDWTSEALFEEVFSRLFNPSFTIRLG